MKTFEDLMANLKPTIADYKYFTDFEKVYLKVLEYRDELNILNNLNGVPLDKIETEFLKLMDKNPDVIKAIPIMLALRNNQVGVIDEKLKIFDFKKNNNAPEEYTKFLQETGIFRLLSENKISNIDDYILGVEVGLDSNARKNRTGTSMENIVENFLSNVAHDIVYHRQFSKKDIKETYGVDIEFHNQENVKFAEKRFDFVVKTNKMIYLIEVNFYGSNGSKLNETARSYKSLNGELVNNKNVTFIWITDGIGWKQAKNNLNETYDSIEHLYILKDLEEGILNKVLK
ncbi:type II restriction enzyme [Williamsoniiplasma lucivorax]|uniref:Type-2 restriction enzyme n=2 Tax=Williamsoniiplasma lucivorax TaxID=209274 RepID=A0A2S5RFM4_9MOLU|nr:type II restriction enzyme [Williamsoniiplasma lucivorax]